jgi:hypothetical protein
MTTKVALMAAVVIAFALAIGVTSAVAQDNVYAVGYFANAHATGAPGAQLRLTNDGSYTAAGVSQNLCAAIYVFNNDEEMTECCSCAVTPDQYLDLSVNNNLTSSIEESGTENYRGIIKVVSTQVPATGVCSPVSYTAAPGIRGWLTRIQAGATAGTFSITEGDLKDSALSGYELNTNLEQTCSFVLALGSGTKGACSCTDAGH